MHPKNVLIEICRSAVTVAAIFVRDGLLRMLFEKGGLSAGCTLRPGSEISMPLGILDWGSGSIRHSFHLISVALTLTVSAKETLCKSALLLLVEARVQWLGGIGEFLLIVGTLDLGIGVLSHRI
jgi:hypothetical protein